MKCSPFLYFSLKLFLLVIVLGNPKHSTAQLSTDTIAFYRKAILAPEKPENIAAGMQFYQTKKISDLKNQDTLLAITDLRMLAIGDFKIGNTYDSENHIVEALALIDGLHYKDTMVNAQVGLYNTLGRIYRTADNTEAALQVFDKALAITKSLKETIILLNNKANLYKNAGQYDLALEAYTLAFEKVKDADKPSQLALVLDNIGAVQSKLEHPEALINLEKALAIREKDHNSLGLYASYRNLSDYYFDRNDQTKANAFAQKAYAVAENINSSSFKLDALSRFIKLNDNPYAKEFQRLTDSITKAKQAASNKNAYLKFNVAQEQKKTAESKLQQEIEAKKRLRYQFLVVVLLLLFLASYFIFRYRKRQANIAAVYHTETRISKTVHDEVANDVYKLMNAMENTNADTPELLNELEKIYHKTRDISRANRSLDVSVDFESLLNDLFLSYRNEQVQIVTRNLSKINWKSVTAVKKRTLYRVLQELLTNMKKHSQASSVALVFEKKGSKVQVKYSDNGVGSDLKHKNGLQITESRMESVNGRISFESNINKGFKATLIV